MTLTNSIIDFQQLKLCLKGQITNNTLTRAKPKQKLSIFVSSTFTDTYRERAILHEKVLPILSERARSENIVVTFYDMRFGIKDETSRDEAIWKVCEAGIKECAEESDGLFFLSLQGDKYGFRPLPKYLDSNIFRNATASNQEKTTNYVNQQTRRLGMAWYCLDENEASSPALELKGQQFMSNQAYWSLVLPKLRDTLFNDLSFDPFSAPELLVNRSITEWETLKAKQLDVDRSRCLWVKRKFDRQSLWELHLSEPRKVQALCDHLQDEAIAEKVQSLQSCLANSFQTIAPRFSRPLLARDYLDEKSPLAAEYLQKWQEEVTHSLLEEVEKVVRKKKEWTAGLEQFFGLPSDYLEEMLHHHSLGAAKASNFVGRRASKSSNHFECPHTNSLTLPPHASKT